MWPNLAELLCQTDRLRAERSLIRFIIPAPLASARAKSRGLWAMGGLQMLFEQAGGQRIWNPEVDWENFTDGLRGRPGALKCCVAAPQTCTHRIYGQQDPGGPGSGPETDRTEQVCSILCDLDHRVVIRSQSIPFLPFPGKQPSQSQRICSQRNCKGQVLPS